jgi:hypothetical protein
MLAHALLRVQILLVGHLRSQFQLLWLLLPALVQLRSGLLLLLRLLLLCLLLPALVQLRSGLLLLLV